MKVIFLALFLLLLLISSVQAISVKDFNFNISSTSIQSNGKAHVLLGKLYGNGSIEDSTRLNHKDVLVASENEHKHELFVTTRKGGGVRGGGRGAGRGGGSGRGGAGAGAAAAAGAGTIGVRGVRGGHHTNNVTPSLFPGTHFWVTKFILHLSLALTTLFLIH